MSVILGITFGHADSSACLVVDGKLTSAIAEERLGERMKHCPNFPEHAIRLVLADGGVSLADVTHVAVARNPNANLKAKMRYVFQHPVQSAGAVMEHYRRRHRPSESLSRLAAICNTDPDKVQFQTVGVEHHLSHIASAYYLSPFDGLTAGFSYDGSGDFVSAMAARCEGNRIDVLDRVSLPHSLGFFYTALSQFIGFDQYGEEYKVMGLNAYGQDNHHDLMVRLLHLDNARWFRLRNGYFSMHQGRPSGAIDHHGHLIMDPLYASHLIRDLGPPRKREDPITQREKDVARSLQVRFEEAAVHCFRRLHRLVPADQVAYAGGCALNGVANTRILHDTPFQKAYLQCASGDDGNAIGAAYYCYHNVIGGRERFHMEHAFWGRQYSDNQMKEAAESCRLPVRRFQDKALLDTVARLIHEGLVVGWFQGRSEWGPRALGNRSILANPARPDMQGIINAKIKRREQFRPFAPTVLKEHVSTYFEDDILSPFMMHVVKLRPSWREKLPAVTHIDGTGRLQSLERSHNPRYYDLIATFARLSGISVLLNTSFNENEPIIETPAEAVSCFLRNDVDMLCLGNYVVCKPQHEAKLQ